jgi:hypothetical protein
LDDNAKRGLEDQIMVMLLMQQAQEGNSFDRRFKWTWPKLGIRVARDRFH